jgi:molecular chaperone HtpG
MRVDSDVVDKLILKDEKHESKLSETQKDELRPVFSSHLQGSEHFYVMYEDLSETDNPIIITQSEFMRRMKDMSKFGGGGGMGFYGEMPSSYNLVINSNHPLIQEIVKDTEKKVGKEVGTINNELTPFETEAQKLRTELDKKKEEEKKQAEKDKIEELDKKVKELTDKKNSVLTAYGKENKLVKQLIDLALLSNNMLKGEELTKFIKRSVELIKH